MAISRKTKVAQLNNMSQSMPVTPKTPSIPKKGNNMSMPTNPKMSNLPTGAKPIADIKIIGVPKKKIHPGFANVQNKISKSEGIPMANAGAILASSTRNASAKAKAKNKNLAKVKSAKKPTGNTPPWFNQK